VSYWAKTPTPREQQVLFSPTLDAMIDEGHPVRLLEEILATCDFSSWEQAYDGSRGQPPIHPRILAGILLYGLTRSIRSSRHLEYLAENNLDFMWLSQGHRPDHSTLCGFRRRFHDELKGLFKQIGRIAMTMGLVRLGEITLDGTRVKANNSRFATATGEKLKKRLAALDAQIEQLLSEAEAADKADELEFFANESTRELPAELAELEQRKAQLEAAIEKVAAADEQRRKEGVNPKKNPAQLPLTDQDSKVLPNKEGGYAPNYTPLAAADTHRGYLVEADVLAQANEQSATVATVDRVEETFETRPKRLLADKPHGTGKNLSELEKRGVELLSPIESKQPQEGNPAFREDPSQPVPEAEWEKLPRNKISKKLDKSAFVYDEANDVYYCPQGKVLEYAQTCSEYRGGVKTRRRIYRCKECEGCPLRGECQKPNATSNRSVQRDEHEKQRERLAAKMQTDEAQTAYRRRLHAGETPFAVIKRIMGLRQFLMRGLERVKTEWLWACTAFNLAKLIRDVSRLRTKFATLAVNAAG
jgi:transposase